MLNDFKKFLIKGNAIDMAVGFIFGAAFATVIKSLIKYIIMPPIGVLLGAVDFSELSYELLPKTETADAVVISYGLFLNDVVSFVILGFVIFMMVRTISKFQKKEETAPKAPPKNEVLLEEIRDILKKK